MWCCRRRSLRVGNSGAGSGRSEAETKNDACSHASRGNSSNSQKAEEGSRSAVDKRPSVDDDDSVIPPSEGKALDGAHSKSGNYSASFSGDLVVTEAYSDEYFSTEYELAGYTFEDIIGGGGSSDVVRMSKNGHMYAVKVCHIGKVNFMQVATHDPKEEAAILRRFDHPHVVKVFDFIDDKDNDRVFIVMELLSGGTIMECKTVEEKRVAFSQAVSALQYMHGQRIAHRDIKTDNIMRHEDGTIRIVDFGLSLFVAEGDGEVPVADVGTRAFAAPEIGSAHTYNPFVADIWALGISLYAMMFGEVPFMASTPFEMQELVSTTEPVFPKKADPEVVDIIQKMLIKDPSDRITLEEIRHHLFLSSITVPESSSDTGLSQIFRSVSALDKKNSIASVSRGAVKNSGRWANEFARAGTLKPQRRRGKL